MAKHNRPTSKSARKRSPKKKTPKGSISNKRRPKKPNYSAQEEFAPKCEYYRGDDIKEMRRKLKGTTFTIASMNKHEFDSGDYAWLMGTEELDKSFKVNDKNGRNLAEEFGDDIDSWVGGCLTITATEYGTGWGVLMDPLTGDEGDDEEEEEDDEDDLPADEDDELE